jgi:hypothetical protein
VTHLNGAKVAGFHAKATKKAPRQIVPVFGHLSIPTLALSLHFDDVVGTGPHTQAASGALWLARLGIPQVHQRPTEAGEHGQLLLRVLYREESTQLRIGPGSFSKPCVAQVALDEMLARNPKTFDYA